MSGEKNIVPGANSGVVLMRNHCTARWRQRRIGWPRFLWLEIGTGNLQGHQLALLTTTLLNVETVSVCHGATQRAGCWFLKEQEAVGRGRVISH